MATRISADKLKKQSEVALALRLHYRRGVTSELGGEQIVMSSGSTVASFCLKSTIIVLKHKNIRLC